jgi:TolB-like protein
MSRQGPSSGRSPALHTRGKISSSFSREPVIYWVIRQLTHSILHLVLNRLAGPLLLSIVAPLFAEGGRYTIAVSDLVGQSVDQPSASILSDRLRTELFKTGRITVLERSAMQDILKEQGFQQSGGCASDSCMVEVGQLLGVSHVVAGTIGKLGSMYMLDIRMVEVSSGKIVYSESVDCEGAIEKVVTVSIPLIAKKIARHVTDPSADSVPMAVQKDTAAPAPLYGRLTVNSTPSGAQVLLNGAVSGTTPYETLKLTAGRYRLRLELPAYVPVDDSFTVAAGQVCKREFSLEHTVAWRDSVAGARNDSLKSIAAARRDSLRSIAAAKQAAQAKAGQETKKSPALKITFALLSLASGAAGVWCDFAVKDRISKNDGLRDEYASLPDNSLYADYSSRITRNSGSAKTFKTLEYCSYGLAGACAAGFLISFAF